MNKIKLLARQVDGVTLVEQTPEQPNAEADRTEHQEAGEGREIAEAIARPGERDEHPRQAERSASEPVAWRCCRRRWRCAKNSCVST